MSSDRSCSREAEILALLERGLYGHGDEVRAHVRDCVSCTELVEVASALLDDRRQTSANHTLPSSGLMWWRMQLREKHEAARTVRRSVGIAQTVTIAAALIVAVALAGFASLIEVWKQIATVVSLEALTSQGSMAAIVLFVMTWAVLAPIALYFAVARD